MNLVGNAIKFTEHGVVRMSRVARPPMADCVHIAVADTGIGMDAEVAVARVRGVLSGGQRITRQYGGSGLGLAISRRLARAMGGEIEVASEPGQGSAFTLSVPVACRRERTAAEDVARHDARMAMHAARPTEDREAPAVSVAAFSDDEAALAMLAKQRCARRAARVDD